MNVTPDIFEDAVAALPLERPIDPRVVRTLSLLLAILEHDDSFRGGCYNITAIGHILLAAQGVVSTPCLGEVACEVGPYDHAWLEIDSAIHDLPIQYPMPGCPATPIVIGGLHLDGTVPQHLYAVDPASYGGGWDPQGERAQVEPRTLPEYLDYVEELGLPVWAGLRMFGKALGLSLHRDAVRKTHAATRWVVRAGTPVPEAMTRAWIRLQPVT